MASVKRIKKDIDYLMSEVLSDCYMAIYFHPEKKAEIVTIMQDATQLRNELFTRISNPTEKNNSTLVSKHYAQIRRDVIAGIDGFFSKLSEACK